MFLDIAQGVRLDEQQDKVCWELEKNKIYSTKSLYRFLTFRGAKIARMSKIWKTKIPLKIKIFLWQMEYDKLQTGVCLKKMGWRGSDRCGICGRLEDSDHIFFQMLNCMLYLAHFERGVWMGLYSCFICGLLEKLDSL